MPTIEARLGSLSINGAAGMSVDVELTFLDADESPSDLSDGVSIWLGGSSADLDDFTDADEIVATIAANVATATVPVPSGSDVLLRVAVGDVTKTVGKLRAMHRGGESDLTATLQTLDAAQVTVEVLGSIASGGGGGGGAPVGAGYLVTAAHVDLTNETVVGATPGGELGGTWANITVDALHSGSTHAAVQAAAEATAAAALATHEADTTNVHGITNTALLETTAGAQAKADAKVTQTITNGVTTTAPSEDAVFDALALKAPTANPTFTGTVTIPDGALAIADTNGLQAALDAKAPTANPTFTGTVTIPDGALAIADTSGLQAALDAKAADADVVHDTGAETIAGVKTFSSDPIIPDEAYDATAWNGVLEPPTKNAVRDKIEDILDGVTFTGDIVVPDEAYDATGWNGSLEVPTKNAIRDKIESMGGGGGGTVDSVVAGSNIDVDATDPANPIVSVEALTSGDLTDFAEAVSDQVGTMVTGNTETGITVTYQDADNTLDFELVDEYLQDVVGAMVSGGTETGIAVTYDDTNGRLDFVAEVTQAELDLKAPLASPTFTGTVVVPDNTFALGKLVDIATARILGRVTASSGDIEELTAAQVRTLLGLVIGTNVQAWDADLDTLAALSSIANLTALAGLTGAADKGIRFTGAGAMATFDQTAAGRSMAGAADAAAQALLLGAEVFKQAQAVNAQTGTTYTLVAGDAGKLVTLSNASAITLTVPQDSDATIVVGTYTDLMQLGAGQVTVAAGSGATLRTSGLTAKARAQYSRLGVQKISANTWSLFGDLAAS